MADNWERVVNTTINEYVRGEEINVMRNRKILALLQDEGRVTFNHSGLQMDWKVRYKQVPMIGYADMDTLTFSRQNRWVTAQLPWRGYIITDMCTEFEKQQNKGDEAIVKFFANSATMLMSDLEEQFNDEVYIDGNATGNSKRFHGIKSFFSTSAASTKQPIGIPNDSYAGLNCTLADKGGSWSAPGTTVLATVGNWPAGTGDAHFDYWAPLVVDYTSAVATSAAAGTTGWQASTKTWPNTCIEAIRYGIQKGQRNKSKRGNINVITLEGELYRLLLDKLQAEEQINVDRTSSGLRKLGFTDVVNIDGMDVTWEYGIPSDEGYGWCTSAMELASLNERLFMNQPVDYDVSSMSYRYSLYIFGNYKFASPRSFIQWKNIS